MTRPLRVFLCHSSADKPAVRELYQKLRAEPWIQPWLKEEELLGGQNTGLEINKAIRDADAIIICLSITSVKEEGYVNKEIRRALDIAQEKPDGTIYNIPLRFDNCTTSFEQLKELQWVDYFLPNTHEKLLKSLQARAIALGLMLSRVESEESYIKKDGLSNYLVVFSSNLDGLTSGENIDYSGKRFLTRVKTAPPFLDFEKSILSPDHERNLAEYFRAKKFIEDNKGRIKGGGVYQVKPGQSSFENIAQEELGNSKYANQIKAANPGVLTTKTGQNIYFPYIDISDTLELSSEQIKRKFEVAQDKWIEPILKQLIAQFNLLEDNALDLLLMVYTASAKTLIDLKK